jgi:hypothetical protein
MAGRIQQSGRFAMLVPRELGPSITSANVPLPPSKPAPSLASFAFRSVVPPAKPEPLRMLRPATLDRIAPSARSEPSQLAARALRSGAPHPLEPSAKREPSRVAASTPAEPPPPAKPKPSQVAARARQPGAPPVVTKPGLSEVDARTFQPAARAPGKPGQAMLDRIAPSARSEPSQLATRTLRSGAPRPPEPSAKHKPSRIAAPTPAGAPPPAKGSHVAAKARQPDAPPVVTRPGLSELGARTFQPAARAPGEPGQAMLDRIAPSARSEPSQLATRTLRSGAPRPLEPSAKREPSRIAAPTPAEPPAPAKPRPSQVAARARQPDAPPVVTKPGLSEVGARTLQPAARAPGKPGQGASPSAHEIARRPHRPATRI